MIYLITWKNWDRNKFKFRGFKKQWITDAEVLNKNVSNESKSWKRRNTLGKLILSENQSQNTSRK